MGWADHFTETAPDYWRYRPIYPTALFDQLSMLAPSHELTWDCGTGNGQAALGLAPHFDAVVGTDASVAQLLQSRRPANVHFVACRAEAVPLPDDCVSLATAAQALHWFAGEDYFREVKRVAKDGAVVAAWSYMLADLGPELDPILQRFYRDAIGPYWPPEREHVVAGYATLPFPFHELTPPDFTMTASWTLDHFLGYINTWSAVKRARAKTNRDPLPALSASLHKVWGEPHVARLVSWPLRMRIGTVKK